MSATILKKGCKACARRYFRRQYFRGMVDSRQVRLALRQLRTDAKVTPEALAERAGVDRATVYRIEDLDDAYQPRIETISKLADGLGVSMSAFFGAIETVLSNVDRSDLGDHSEDQASMPTGGVGASSHQTRLLEERITQLETALGQTRDVALRLLELAAIGDQDAARAAREAGSGSSPRKTG